MSGSFLVILLLLAIATISFVVGIIMLFVSLLRWRKRKKNEKINE